MPGRNRAAHLKSTLSEHFEPINPVFYKDVHKKKERGFGVFKEKDKTLGMMYKNPSLSR